MSSAFCKQIATIPPNPCPVCSWWDVDQIPIWAGDVPPVGQKVPYIVGYTPAMFENCGPISAEVCPVWDGYFRGHDIAANNCFWSARAAVGHVRLDQCVVVPFLYFDTNCLGGNPYCFTLTLSNGVDSSILWSGGFVIPEPGAGPDDPPGMPELCSEFTLGNIFPEDPAKEPCATFPLSVTLAFGIAP